MNLFFANGITSWIGLLFLDNDLNPLGDPQILSLRAPDSTVPPRGEDARLFYVGKQLHIAYSDNPYPKITRGGFRMVIAALHYDGTHFVLRDVNRLTCYEGESDGLREKNWVPFSYNNTLLLAYSITPHSILSPTPLSGYCETIAITQTPPSWQWGILRGGTPAIQLETGEYLAFFHSVKKMASVQSQKEEVAHYFMGAYIFESAPPFRIVQMSEEPISAPPFYEGAVYKPYWGPIQCVFPGGIILEKNEIWVAYGRQDHEVWVAKMDKEKLLTSLKKLPY